jgi:hypothetical protein
MWIDCFAGLEGVVGEGVGRCVQGWGRVVKEVAFGEFGLCIFQIVYFSPAPDSNLCGV